MEKFSESLKNTSGPSIKFRSACFRCVFPLLRNRGEGTQEEKRRNKRTGEKERERVEKRRRQENSNNLRKVLILENRSKKKERKKEKGYFWRNFDTVDLSLIVVSQNHDLNLILK